VSKRIESGKAPRLSEADWPSRENFATDSGRTSLREPGERRKKNEGGRKFSWRPPQLDTGGGVVETSWAKINPSMKYYGGGGGKNSDGKKVGLLT